MYENGIACTEAPSPIQQRLPDRVVINKVPGGFVVEVGCRMFVLKSPEELGKAVEHYFNNPKKAFEYLFPDLDFKEFMRGV